MPAKYRLLFSCRNPNRLYPDQTQQPSPVFLELPRAGGGQNSRKTVSTVTHAGTARLALSRAGTNFHPRTVSTALSSNPKPMPLTMRTSCARPSAPTRTTSVTVPCTFPCRASSVYVGYGQYAHPGGTIPGPNAPFPVPSPPGPVPPSPTVSPSCDPKLWPFPGPAEFVSVGIHGSPGRSVSVRTGAAFGSKMVGGSGKRCSCCCGSVGLTRTIGEGRRFPRV